ncbi:MAG: LysE family translocator [SAR324 cluster bacterium]|nr:LysE family translocator [SAR324 cluster bacterium]
MSLELMYKGIGMGFLIAAPVGPIGLLCIKRTINEGFKAGLATGLGAAFADGLYGFMAAFGLAVITNFLVEQQEWLSWLGSLFLIYLGGRSLLSKSSQQEILVAKARHIFSNFASTFMLTLTNPVTILSFAAIFTSLKIGQQENYFLASLLVFGVFLGSILWWFFLSTAVVLIRQKITKEGVLWVNRLAGGTMIGFAIYLLAGK